MGVYGRGKKRAWIGTGWARGGCYKFAVYQQRGGRFGSKKGEGAPLKIGPKIEMMGTDAETVMLM